MGPRRRRRPRAGLRRRVAVSFGLLSLFIVGVLASATWLLTSDYLVDRRQATASDQVRRDAVLVGDRLARAAPDLPTLLSGIAGKAGSGVAVRRGEAWTVAGRVPDLAGLPPEVVAPPGGVAVRELASVDGPVLAVATPVAGADVLVEFDPLTELDATVHFLGLLLVAATLVAGALGLGLGWWTGGRALRPVRELATAAGRVASGDLAARLPEQHDADLAPLATTFNRTADDLEHRVRRDSRFAGDVSHELRSPLTTLVAAAGILRHRRDEMPGAAREAVEMLDLELHRFSDLVGDLLEISRQSEETDPRDLEIVDLGELTTAVAREHWRGCATEFTGDDLRVLGDRRRLRQVLLNLGHNAERHGGGLVRIGLSRGPEGVRWEVDDAGPGVPPGLRGRVFDRFDRGGGAGDRRDAAGSGLGLAVVAGHVRRHDGRITIDDRPGGGARVVVVLPPVDEVVS